MRNQLFGFTAAAALSFLTAGQAVASAVDDANAGEAALNRNDYNTAIEMFTRSIASGGLSPADAESVYVERAKAYIGRGDGSAAQSDLNVARQLNPRDPDIASLQAKVEIVHAPTDTNRDVAPKPSAPQERGDGPGGNLDNIPAPFRDFFRQFGQGQEQDQGGGRNRPQPEDR